MRKPTKTSLRNKLDKECSRIVRAIGACQFCGKADYSHLQCCHIISRSHLGLRFRLDNLLCLCDGCHFHAHKDPLDFADRVKELLGEGLYAEIRLASRSITKWTVQEMQELLDAMRRIHD